MKHPNTETWMAYLYKELGKAERAECDRHLKGCPECQAEMERWRTGMEWLDHDSASLVIAQGKNVVRFWQQPMLRWAAAAAVILTSGFAMGRLSQPSNDDLDKKLAEMREVITRDVQARNQQDLQEVARVTLQQQQQWFEGMAQHLSLQQADYQKTMLQAIDEEIFPLRTGMVRLAQFTGQSFSEFANLVNNRLSPEDNATNTVDKGN
ncbi:MAG TPA: zf-HC2 domain-containing protein [Candidatus Limnocylindria bacterium]|nr:zf-HC2 domain-containing protein [Candidatus Limnocylindria bacterium]